jgi:Skp family chaperone for outer membrane proteins
VNEQAPAPSKPLPGPIQGELAELEKDIRMLRKAIQKVYKMESDSDDLRGTAYALQAISQATRQLFELVRAHGATDTTNDVGKALQIALDELTQEMNQFEETAEQLSFPLFPSFPGNHPARRWDDPPDAD